MTAGAPSLLTDRLKWDIRKGILEGKKYTEIRADLGIIEGTWDCWVQRDTNEFRQCLLKWKSEKLLGMALNNMEDLLGSENESVRAKVSMFVAETAGKEVFSKRTESTGKDGTPIEHQFSLKSLLEKAK